MHLKVSLLLFTVLFIQSCSQQDVGMSGTNGTQNSSQENQEDEQQLDRNSSNVESDSSSEEKPATSEIIDPPIWINGSYLACLITESGPDVNYVTCEFRSRTDDLKVILPQELSISFSVNDSLGKSYNMGARSEPDSYGMTYTRDRQESITIDYTVSSSVDGSSASGRVTLPEAIRASDPANTTDPNIQNSQGGSGVALNLTFDQDFVVFQDDANTSLENRDGSAVVTRYGTAAQYGIGAYSDPNDSYKTKFFTVDRLNNRVLIFNKVPTSNSAVPDVVVGQSDFNQGLVNAGRASASSLGLYRPTQLSVCDDGKLMISDSGNNRILVFNKIPTSNGTSADLVIGQPDLTSTEPGLAANRLHFPYGAHCIDNKLFVIDRFNHRILIFNSFPTENGASADLVNGQNTMDEGLESCSATGLSGPYDILLVGEKLFVADGNHHRILVYPTIPKENGATAERVIGQPDFISCLANRGSLDSEGNSLASASSLYLPNSLAVKENLLSVVDFENRRLLFFPLDADSSTEAVGLIGQPDFTTSMIQPVVIDSFLGARGVVFAKNAIFVGGDKLNRLALIKLPESLMKTFKKP